MLLNPSLSIMVLLMSLSFSGAMSYAEEDADPGVTWEESNCRTQSSLYPEAKGWSYITGMPGRPAIGVERDLQLKNCMDSQRSVVLRSVLQDTNITQFEDRGSAEFYPPGNRKDLSRCSYYVKKGEKVSSEVQLYLKGKVIYNNGDDFQKYYERVLAIERELEEIVFIECAIS